MDTGILLSWLLGIAVLVPLASFVIILLIGPLMGQGGRQAGLCATAAILTSCVLSLLALGIWLNHHPPLAQEHGHHAADTQGHAEADAAHTAPHENQQAADVGEAHAAEAHADVPPYYHREVYTLGKFLGGQVTISVYIDALTVCMFTMVTIIATCIHFYAIGYMHDELASDYVDHEVVMADGSPLHRRGRFPRFFQALSLFCFSMLGLVLAGNIAMTFVFWELVGICSYFLIGFYVERQSASNAANKAFIVNRVGDFGMIIGLMVLWSTLGTFSFGGDQGIFAQVRPGESHELIVPDGMVKAAAAQQVARLVSDLGPDATAEQIDAAINEQIPHWRAATGKGEPGRAARWLLIVAGVGIFCGCVGKSAQFPLHVWLPDAMEGPTPVSALVHSATMVAAGVFLVARFYPVFSPEVLLIIAIVGMITLFLAATIAIVATDIKRVLAYSTVSQLGYMMLSLGVGGWLAGTLHLFTHAFFKSLLFMCSGSVIHAVHTNDMTEMGGLRKKMPWTAYTMLVGCLAIAGAGIPFVIGFSGYYSKDAILEQALSFRQANPGWGTLFFIAAAGGAAMTAFYMFRLWYLTFAGKPRNPKRFDHAHESPPVMYRPLILLATFAVAVAWGPREAIIGSLMAVALFAAIKLWRGSRGATSHDADTHSGHSASTPGAHAVLGHGHHGHDDHGHDDHRHEDHGHGGHASGHGMSRPSGNPLNVATGIAVVVFLIGLVWTQFEQVTLSSLLEQARPAGTLPTTSASLLAMSWPNEHDSHAPSIKVPATIIAFSTAMAGFLLSTMFYGLRKLDAAESQRAFAPIYRFLVNKWWFDELYEVLFVRPVHWVARAASGFDRRWIDGFIDGAAACVRRFATIWDRVADRTIVDGCVNLFAAKTYDLGIALRRIQTGSLRQYVMFIVIGTVVVFAVASLWRHALAY